MAIVTQDNGSIGGKSVSQMVFGGCEFLKIMDRLQELNWEIKKFYYSQQLQNQESLNKKQDQIQQLAKELNKLGLSNDEINKYRTIDYLNFLDGVLVKSLTKTDEYYYAKMRYNEGNETRIHNICFDDYNFYIDGKDVSADWRKHMHAIMPEVFKDNYRKGLKEFIEAKQKMENDNLFC